MDWGALYHFVFETYQGVGISILICLAVCVLAAFITEKRTRNKYQDRPKGEDDFDLFDDDDDMYDEEGRLIELSLVYKNGDLRIGIRNRYAEEPRKDSKGTFLSSKNNSEYHGIGLYSIRETVKKYHGFMDIHTENKIFSLVIVIREEKSC
mgnify:CR=1 FL=1